MLAPVEGMTNAYKRLVGKLEEERLLLRPRRRSEGDINGL
jgi:hypothetical protein